MAVITKLCELRRKKDDEIIKNFISVSSFKDIVKVGVKARDAEIFLMRVAGQKKLKEIAVDFDLTNERIRQIVTKVRRKILRAGR